MLPEVSVVLSAYRPETRIDVALLGSALFLQRFSLPFGNTRLALDFVPTAFILLHQFVSGKLVIQYDRLLWFIAVVLTASCSLLSNFERTSLTSVSQFLVLSSLFTLIRPSSPGCYKRTLQAFQSLVMFLSFLAVAQFVAQFVVNGMEIIMFFGMIPDVLNGGGAHTIHAIEGSSLLKSNGVFLAEPSNFTQVVALGILIEVLEFRRPRYLLVMVLGFLLAYSGAGMMTLLVLLPLASLREGKVAQSVLLAGIFALGLFATGIIDFSVFHSRSAEFEQVGSSGFGRFIGPYWSVTKFFDTAPLQAILVGYGPGAKSQLGDDWFVVGWFRQFYEYGLIGSFIFICFLSSCLRRSRCPRLVLAGAVFTYFLIADSLSTWVSTIVIVLCTLHGPEPRRGRVAREPGTLPELAPAGG